MEKSVSLTHEEATVLLEMSLFTYLDWGEAASSAMAKLGDLCREFSSDEGRERDPHGRVLVRR